MDSYEKRGYLLENFRLFHLRSQEALQVEYHYHEFCKLLLLVSGSGGYVVDGKRYMLQAGDAVLIGSHCVHRPELAGDYERIIIYISPDYLVQTSTPDCELHQIFSGSTGHVLRLQEHGRKKLFALAAQLEKDLQAEGFGRTLLGQTGLLRLLIEVGKGILCKEDQFPGPVAPGNDRILELLRYIDAHAAEPLNIDALADMFYISKYHMMRLFHRETGITVHAYLTQRRLLLARAWIDGGMRATEACYSSGFHSYSTFTRAYAKYFGTTPTGRTEPTHGEKDIFE